MFCSRLMRSKRIPIFRGILSRSCLNAHSVLVSKRFSSVKDSGTESNWLKKAGMHPEQLTVKKREEFNRWWLIPAAITNHVCLGAAYAWSIFNEPLTRINGVIVPAASDWTLVDISLVFSLIMGGFGWGAVLGKYLHRFGPRASCLIGSVSLGGGFCLGSVAIQTQNLYLLYAGGAVWGFANGWAYVPPIATLIQWFPERKGFASCCGVLGFGLGAFVAAPIFTKLLSHFRIAPEYVGSINSVDLVNESGRLYTQFGDSLREVIVATTADAQPFGLSEGVYLVGTGSTGAAETFMVLGIGYSLCMITSSFIYRLPPPSIAETNSIKAAPKVTADAATRTHQFWLMWVGFGLYSTGAQGFIGSASTIMKESILTSLPNDIPTGTLVASFVALLSVGNITGRIIWPNVSDVLAKWKHDDLFYGRKLTYTIMWGTAIPCYFVAAWSIHKCAELQSMLPVGIFCISSAVVISGFGGATATRPAIIGDIYGDSNVLILTARQLSVVLLSSYCGPKIFTTLREYAVIDAIKDLTQKVTDSNFQNAFGCGKDQIDALILNNTITINRLMDLVPEGTIDPTPFVFDQPLYVMAGLSTCALISNELLRPLNHKKKIKKTEISM